MEALDRESFEFRADFLGRTLEEELVGSLDGPRRAEASHELARIRGVRVSELLDRAVGSVPPTDVSAPSRVFGVDECPVCTGTDQFGALECGHVVCRVCYDEICPRSAHRACPCPQCRALSRRLWDLKELEGVVEHV